MSKSVCVWVWVCVSWLVCVTAREHICQKCQCLPDGLNPIQALCGNNAATNKTFEPLIAEESKSLELVYIYGMISVILSENSLETENPLTLLIQNCSHIYIANKAVTKLRTLIIREAESVKVADLPEQGLWALLLENIQQMEINSRSLTAEYSVSIGRINSLTLLPSLFDNCSSNQNYQFLLFNSKVQSLPTGGLPLCGGKDITINGNNFTHIAEDGVQISSDGTIALVYNTFENVSKKSFNLSSPEIYITNNNFKHLPEGALRGVSTYGDTFFTNNTIEDIDLGGVLLDMGWDMTIEENIIDCDCTSKRTSILNPKEDMLYLTNSSFDKLENIFLNNFCNLNCTLTLKDFSLALRHSEVCLTNKTQLEEEALCHITTVDADISSTPETTVGAKEEIESTTHSSASRIEIILPVSIVLIAVLVMCSLFYGGKEIITFKYKFDPHQSSLSKISAE